MSLLGHGPKNSVEHNESAPPAKADIERTSFEVRLFFAASTGFIQSQDIDESAKRGAAAYRLCAAGHTLQPGVHLSGPSLANMLGRRAATLSDFGRYTDALRKQKIKTMLARTSLTTFPCEEVKQVLDFWRISL
jgi:cytochrome c2